MWSATDQPTTRLEQMPMTVARWSHEAPTAMYVMAPHHPALSVFAVNSLFSRSARRGTRDPGGPGG